MLKGRFLPEGPVTHRNCRRVLRTIEFHAAAGKNAQGHGISKLRLALESKFSIFQGILWDRFSQYVQTVLIAISSHTLWIWIFRSIPNITFRLFLFSYHSHSLQPQFHDRCHAICEKGAFCPKGPSLTEAAEQEYERSSQLWFHWIQTWQKIWKETQWKGNTSCRSSRHFEKRTSDHIDRRR